MPGPLDDQIMNSAQTMEHPPLVQKPFLMDLCDGSEMRLPNALSTMRSESSNLRRTELSVEPFLLRDYSVDQDAHRSLDPYVKEEESQRARFSGHQALGAVHHQTPGIENGTAQVRSPSASKRLELEASPSPRFSYVISPLKRNNEQDAPRRSDEVSPMNVESATLNRILEFDASVTNMLPRAPSATSEKDSHAEKVYQTFHTARKMTSISPSFTPLPPPFTPPLFSNSRTSQEASVNPLTEDPQTMLQHLFFPHTVQAGLPSTAMFPVPPSSFMTGTRPYSFPGPYNLLNSSYPWGGMMLPNKIEKKQEFVEIKNPTCDKCGKVVINSDYKSHNKLCAGKICNRCRVAVTGSYEEHKLQCSMRMCDRCGMIPTESFAEHNKLCKSALRLHISEPRHPIRPITADASRCTEDTSKNVAHRALPNEVIESKNFTSTAQRSSENEGKKKERLVTCPICMALVPPMDLEENENGIRKHDNSCGNVCSYCCRIYDGSIEVHFGRCLQYIRDQIQSMKS